LRPDNNFPDAFAGSSVNLRPNILILAGVDPDTGEKRLNQRWFDAFSRHNVRFTVLDPTCATRDQAEIMAKAADGILLTGNDLNVLPEFYGAEPLSQRALWKEVPRHCYSRDRFDNSRCLIESAIRLDTPILGVCLGSQEMNVVLGGRLQQRIDSHMTAHADTDDLWDDTWHGITVRPGQLADIFGDKGVFPENSVHRQGVLLSDLAGPLRIDAVSLDGRVVEAFSLPGHPFFMGVQFHAESSRHQPHNAKIFDRLVAKAHAHMGARMRFDAAHLTTARQTPSVARWLS
ncbi:MAG: gamma-glutamyl-gamma-aminobutyrate hydrolase family protein, partial [Bdellovibrionales bacterium]